MAAKKKAKGTVQIVLTGTGSYTVTGKGFRKTAQSSKTFNVSPGAYKVSAPGASVSRGTVKVKPGKKVTVTIAFPTAPLVTPSPPVQTPPPSDPTTPPPPPADTTPPGKVTGLTASTRTTSSIALAWTNPGDADLAEIMVRRAQGGTAPATPTAGTAVTLGTEKATSVIDSGLAADTTYSYAVFTRDGSDNTNLEPVTLTTSTTGAPDGSGEILRLSVNASSSQANADSYGRPVWSPDGTQVAFRSSASNLVPSDTNRVDDVFVKTLATGAVQRISVDASGTQATNASYDPVWSPDGSKIAFRSYARNLTPTPTSGYSKVLVKTLATGAVQQVTVDATGNEANDDSYSPMWSPDSTQIAFDSLASNLVADDTNHESDVFVKTLATGVIQRISASTSGNQADGSSTDPVWSPDGGSIAFDSYASNLVPGDTNGILDVFVKTLATGVIQRVSTDATGGQAHGYSYSAAWSPDSSRLAFESSASDLVPGDTNGFDVFVKTLATGAIQRVSTDASGGQANEGSGRPAWSPDGTRLAFESDASNLIGGDTNSTSDVFVKTLATGAIRRVSTDATGLQADGYSYFPGWSPDGTRLVFGSTASNLVVGDTNGAQDVFVKTLG